MLGCIVLTNFPMYFFATFFCTVYVYTAGKVWPPTVTISGVIRNGDTIPTVSETRVSYS